MSNEKIAQPETENQGKTLSGASAQTLESIAANVAHARSHLLATIDDRAGDLADDGDLEELRGVLQALHALRAIDVELEAVRS